LSAQEKLHSSDVSKAWWREPQVACYPFFLRAEGAQLAPRDRFIGWVPKAEYGGFLGRKHDGHPGPQAIWQGIEKLRQFTLAWQVYVKRQGYKAYQ